MDENTVFRCECGAWVEKELDHAIELWGRWCKKCQPHYVEEAGGEYVKL
jgi:hypothetical protein